MAGYQRLRDRATMLGRDLLVEGGRQLRIARLAAGLSQAAVAQPSGVSTAMVSRVERALVPGVSITTLARLHAAVGLRLSVKGYPDGDPIRDRPSFGSSNDSGVCFPVVPHGRPRSRFRSPETVEPGMR